MKPASFLGLALVCLTSSAEWNSSPQTPMREWKVGAVPLMSIGDDGTPSALDTEPAA